MEEVHAGMCGPHMNGKVLAKKIPRLDYYWFTIETDYARPLTNGAIEVANKNVKTILRKMVETYKDWPKKLPYTLWHYQTSTRTSTGATPFSLVYGTEEVLPIKLEVESLRVMFEDNVLENVWAQKRYEELALIDEKIMRALYHI
ncbi:uncharacterized protein LOC131172124 [Hevea brasiliensis]|uniref:uncharacterized protein LOC131172124 n=1 Tax=Hevea brasiliensis TaxID=3981 RepID=UPI0025F8BA05|nr:uncharacterized protein LOC131172124 [Hevea brasiliensis]